MPLSSSLGHLLHGGGTAPPPWVPPPQNSKNMPESLLLPDPGITRDGGPLSSSLVAAVPKTKEFAGVVPPP